METLSDERSLNRKFATAWHLNVLELRALPNGKARASLVIDAIHEVLESEGWFPAKWRPDDRFDGGLIEVNGDGSCRIYWKAEVSYSRYEMVSTQEFRSTRKAAEAFARKFFGGDIDGIPLDWST